MLYLSYSGILAIHSALAYFDNAEISESNNITAGILDIFVDPGAEFDPVKLSYGSIDSSTRIIGITNIGTLTTQYQIKIENVVGNLCSYLKLEAELNANIYSTAIAEGNIFLISPNSQIASDITDIWNFTASLISEAPDLSICNFDITFNAWQDNLAITQGFNDSESVSNYLEDPIIIPQSSVVGEDMEQKRDNFQFPISNFQSISNDIISNEDTGEEEIVEESGNEETGPPTSGATERQGELVEEEEPADEELIIEQPKLELNADPTPEGKPLIDEAPVTLPEPISEPEPAIIDEENNNEDE